MDDWNMCRDDKVKANRLYYFVEGEDTQNIQPYL